MTGLADIALRIAKYCGLFALARALTSRRLRILGYHGIAISDEHRFQPMLFMRAETFSSRMNQLARLRYPVLRLGEAVERMGRDTLPQCAVVITIDDGWYGTFRHMAPKLAELGLPATLYLATYYVEKQTQVFNVAAAYALWKAQPARLDLRDVDPRLQGQYRLDSGAARSEAARELSTAADGLSSAAERQELLRRLYEALGLDPAELQTRMLTFMSPAEAAELPPGGVELQLHTHRHRFPAGDSEALAREIEANRASLGRLTDGPFRHLCYPSGEYDRSTFGQLAALGIDSATTTLQGMNTSRTPPLELRRFLDTEEVSAIRFEAELCGFLELLRQIAGRSNYHLDEQPGI